MPKRKYTQEERQRLGIGSSKRKAQSGSVDRKSYRADFYDWDDRQDRRKTSKQQPAAPRNVEDELFNFVGLVGIAVVVMIAVEVIVK